MKSTIITALACLFTGTASFAQTAGKPFNFTILGGFQEYRGDVGNGFYGTTLNTIDDHFLVGASGSVWLSPHFDLMGMGTWGVMEYRSEGKRLFKNDIATYAIDLKYKFCREEARLRPYIFLGAGIIYYDENTIEGREWMPVTGGGGINLRLTNVLSLQYQVRWCYGGRDGHDHVNTGDYSDQYLLNTIGIGFNMGNSKDSDKDKVSDRRDKCPGTPAGVAVDKNGCPLDADNDGVPDFRDQCANVVGTAAASGCPDADNDGVADLYDQCPAEAGTVAMSGCPDRDGDGITDSKDQCPDQRGAAAGNGCPDSDGDGVPDSQDACPQQSGTAATGGCPDRDGDGVGDGVDACPDLAGTSDHRGCPDTDKDGVYDNEDRCITTAGTAANNGCPEVKVKPKTNRRK